MIIVYYYSHYRSCIDLLSSFPSFGEEGRLECIQFKVFALLCGETKKGIYEELIIRRRVIYDIVMTPITMPRHIVLTLLISLYQGSNKQELRRLHIDLKINFGIITISCDIENKLVAK